MSADAANEIAELEKLGENVKSIQSTLQAASLTKRWKHKLIFIYIFTSCFSFTHLYSNNESKTIFNHICMFSYNMS